MRVLHVVCSDGFAGVERHVALLAAAQRAAATVVVIGGDPASMVSATDRPGRHHPARGAPDRDDLARRASVMRRGSDVVQRST